MLPVGYVLIGLALAIGVLKVVALGQRLPQPDDYEVRAARGKVCAAGREEDGAGRIGANRESCRLT